MQEHRNFLHISPNLFGWLLFQHLQHFFYLTIFLVNVFFRDDNEVGELKDKESPGFDLRVKQFRKTRRTSKLDFLTKT